MTLKEELEILRGEPIQEFAGDPMDIPCVETSDSERLCKHPVVSVDMITYNHEPYIRQAIEGVMMQKTDFEFELVIGEDCSTDKTREICFEYQKRYPDKIRVLWCDHNLYRNPHPAGANTRRNLAHCRGEFIAFCEGDDYWIDPQKLQRQVEVMREYPKVGLCFGNGIFHNQGTGEDETWPGAGLYADGLISGKDFFSTYLLGRNPQIGCRAEGFLITASVMVRKRAFAEAIEKYDIFNWKLVLGDKTTWLGVSSLSDVYFLADKVAAYRITGTGAMGTLGGRIFRDSNKVKLYFAIKRPDLIAWPLPFCLTSSPFESLLSLSRNGSVVNWREARNVYRRWLQRGIFSSRNVYWKTKFRWWMFLTFGWVWQFGFGRGAFRELFTKKATHSTLTLLTI